ncbi:hypothetical protein Tco_0236469 [Tanacetum coccineum]
MKVIKEESEVLGLLMIDDDLFTCDTPLRMIFNEINRLSRMDDDLFTCDTPLRMIFNEINRLSRMDDDLFTYEGKIHELSCSPSVEQQVNDLYNGNLDVYERKACYDECEKLYAEAVIFINKRLVRLINVTVEQWLDLKYSDHTMVHEECIMDLLDKRYDDEVITDDEHSNPGDGNLSDEAEIVEIFRIETNIFEFETSLSNMPWLDYGPWMELSDDIEHFCKSFRFKNGHAKCPTCNWKKEKYCNGGYLLGVIRIRDKIYFESYEWYENLEDGTNNDYKTQKNEARFDKHGLMGNEDDDIVDLEDYLIQQGPLTTLTKKKKDPRKEDAI